MRNRIREKERRIEPALRSIGVVPVRGKVSAISSLVHPFSGSSVPFKKEWRNG